MYDTRRPHSHVRGGSRARLFTPDRMRKVSRPEFRFRLTDRLSCRVSWGCAPIRLFACVGGRRITRRTPQKRLSPSPMIPSARASRLACCAGLVSCSTLKRPRVASLCLAVSVAASSMEQPHRKALRRGVPSLDTWRPFTQPPCFRDALLWRDPQNAGKVNIVIGKRAGRRRQDTRGRAADMAHGSPEMRRYLCVCMLVSPFYHVCTDRLTWPHHRRPRRTPSPPRHRRRQHPPPRP